MKDIPVFATENGVAVLALQQIPYTGFAHISIQATQAFDSFLPECAGFCRAVGAENILACGHYELEHFPIYTRILHMQIPRPEDTAEASLFPVTEETLHRWMDIYNQSMKNVPNATILSSKMGRTLLEKGTGYFVHNAGELLGIGIVEGDTVQAVVSCRKGAGEQVMKTLFGAITGDTVKLEVAENNIPAMRLYNRMGFITTGVLKTWYDVTKYF